MNDIDVAKSIIKEINSGYISYGNLHNNQDEGLKLIKDALEKQIAKMPIRRHISVNGDIALFLACPNCKEQLERSNYYIERCRCGQKLKTYKGDFK